MQGACACGAVAFRCTKPSRSVIHCHCGQCRRASGGAFTTWVSFDREGFELHGEASLASYALTSNVARHFCRTCGTHVHTSDQRYPQIVGVPAGVVMSAAGIEPKAHYFVGHQAAWHVIGDDLPRHGGESGFEKLG